MNNDKRFIKESFPAKEVSKESAKEKNNRHGHISSLLIWQARRPPAALRATAYAMLNRRWVCGDTPRPIRIVTRIAPHPKLSLGGQLRGSCASALSQGKDIENRRSLSLFHPSGREVRLDRLMINEMRKEILIIDYKTGEFFKSSQMQEYIETVQALPVVRENEYRVRGEFLEIQL